MDEGACCAKLVSRLHPQVLACPRCHRAGRIRVHRGHRAPVIDDHCDDCRRVFNAFPDTALYGSQEQQRRRLV